jgi:UDP-N-acetylmuramoyl-tripeptide--D-alanyl-D-alanine ligase
MLIALHNFTGYNHDKKMVILGDMLELGEFSEQEHLNILQYLKNYPEIDACLVGKEFFKADKHLLFKTFLNTGALIEYLVQNPVRNNIILIKGSRGIQLENIIEFL